MMFIKKHSILFTSLTILLSPCLQYEIPGRMCKFCTYQIETCTLKGLKYYTLLNCKRAVDNFGISPSFSLNNFAATTTNSSVSTCIPILLKLYPIENMSLLTEAADPRLFRGSQPRYTYKSVYLLFFPLLLYDVDIIFKQKHFFKVNNFYELPISQKNIP